MKVTVRRREKNVGIVSTIGGFIYIVYIYIYIYILIDNLQDDMVVQ